MIASEGRGRPIGAQSELALDVVPEGSEAVSVTVVPQRVDGIESITVELTEAAAAGEAGVDFVDQPTFLLLPVVFETGVIEVGIRSSLRDDAPDYARAFAGVAYGVTADSFESVYIRPMNGSSLNPPAPRDSRAIQYFAYPDWPFDRLREERPDGGFEASADVRPDTWHRLRVEVDEGTVEASIDGRRVLGPVPNLVPVRRGRIGLWVDIGTRAAFADLRVTPAP